MQTIFTSGINEVEVKKELSKQDVSSSINQTNKKVNELANIFHSNKPESAEPDWQSMLLKANDSKEKMKVRIARDAWKAEQKQISYKESVEARQAEAKKLLETPQVNRNNKWYESLKITHPSLYYSTEIQGLRKRDKQASGFGFFLGK